ncbi:MULTISPECIES: glutathione S-transferase [unclassified Sphingopyxis]|uniref:glutathione S-transferase family protein n=1 Tax=unclassified Sphingopyxis TaxID=2614943 RepID=UPI0007300CC7|nr:MULTISPECIES: glutathione S-transferase [unclassified Sphingopyxis]KTE25212.1 glutathione S-transferase [Sphingopyxis sp. H057]KTE53782.1 glutathione S-transferase [Sphingopyxis sp. H073]KTE55941.1 glutathione S-transferase [Sphingopyxis sp. H107]KTE56373.1 glutathione S-transferase [Sphingopyxis sp. H071]KTE67339.1 glutathione S-transferase [Sphingopyxis sp. H100]
MSLIVHHLNNSRSQRILWLLEEIGAPYEIKFYDRDPVTNLAPAELIAVHPLGKSPVLEDAGRIIIESAAIAEYICDYHGGEKLVPQRGTDDHVRHLQWMHFAEGSAMTPILLRIYTARLGEAAAPLEARITQQLDSHFAYMESAVSEDGHFVGDNLTAADIMLSFPAEIAIMQGLAQRFPKLANFVNACHGRPAWRRAREKGGAYYGY